MINHHFKKFLLILSFCVMDSIAYGESVDKLEKSVVKIYLSLNKPNYYRPWDVGSQSSSTGSGVIISDNRILTNAHMASNAIFTEIQKSNDPKRYVATVQYIAHDCELAILKLKNSNEESAFFKDITPVIIGSMPEQRDKLTVYGFPVGGTDLSTTEGNVSRIEVTGYTHSQRELLTIQTDAAINPGNSGGPVFKDNKMIGLAFQTIKSNDAQNTSYVIPISLINRFLKDTEDGKYDGIPDLGILWQKLENQDLRTFLKLAKNQTGILVDKIEYQSSAWGILQEKDVVTSINGHVIGNNGTVLFNGSGKRVDFSYITSLQFIGDTATLTVIRNGNSMSLSIPLKKFTSLVSLPQYDVRPSYYILAGFIFVPLTFNYLDAFEKNDQSINLRCFYEYGISSPEKQEIVIISRMLPNSFNTGYQNIFNLVVEKINGVPIANFSDIIPAFENNTSPYHTIELSNGRVIIVIDKTTAQNATAETLHSLHIPKDRSDNLDSLPH